jgi:hypothetical protein
LTSSLKTRPVYFFKHLGMDHLVQVKSLKGGSNRMNPSNSYMNQRKNHINPSLF